MVGVRRIRQPSDRFNHNYGLCRISEFRALPSLVQCSHVRRANGQTTVIKQAKTTHSIYPGWIVPSQSTIEHNVHLDISLIGPQR